MRFMFFTTFILLFIQRIICPCKNEKRIKFGESDESTKIRKRKIAGYERIVSAIPYQIIHMRIHSDDLKKYETWPELESKNASQLIHLCQKYLICIGMKNEVEVRNASMDLKDLRYTILDEENSLRNIQILNNRNSFTTRPVCMLKCRLKHTTKIIRFVKGNEEYSAFLVEPTNSTLMHFIIVDACHTVIFKKINVEMVDIDSNDSIYEKRLLSLPSKEEIQRATSYQTIHAKINENNLEAYKEWPELEKKNALELDNLCYKYVKCVNQQNFYEKQGNTCFEIKLLKYFRVDKKSQQIENISHQHSHVRRWVKMLRCQSAKNKTYRFIKASDEYSVFETKPTSTRYNLFTIIDACKTDVLNKIEDAEQFDPSLSNENTVTTLEFLESKEELSNDLALRTNYKNEADNITDQQVTTEENKADNSSDPAAVESREANAQDIKREDKASVRNQSDEKINAMEKNSGSDSEATITDDNMYTKYPESEEYDHDDISSLI